MQLRLVTLESRPTLAMMEAAPTRLRPLEAREGAAKSQIKMRAKTVVAAEALAREARAPEAWRAPRERAELAAAERAAPRVAALVRAEIQRLRCA